MDIKERITQMWFAQEQRTSLIKNYGDEMFNAGMREKRFAIIDKMKEIEKGAKNYDTLEAGIMEGFFSLLHELMEE